MLSESKHLSMYTRGRYRTHCPQRFVLDNYSNSTYKHKLMSGQFLRNSKQRYKDYKMDKKIYCLLRVTRPGHVLTEQKTYLKLFLDGKHQSTKNQDSKKLYSSRYLYLLPLVKGQGRIVKDGLISISLWHKPLSFTHSFVNQRTWAEMPGSAIQSGGEGIERRRSIPSIALLVVGSPPFIT